MTVRITSDRQPSAASLSVLDMTGRVVIPPTPVNSEFRILKSELPAGAYFVKVATAETSTTKKLIIR